MRRIFWIAMFAGSFPLMTTLLAAQLFFVGVRAGAGIPAGTFAEAGTSSDGVLRGAKPGLGYGLGTTPWGVPPEAPLECGAGQVRNLTGLPVRRVVVQAPLRPFPSAPWLPGHRHGASTLRALTLHTLRPTLRGLLTTMLHALRP